MPSPMNPYDDMARGRAWNPNTSSPVGAGWGLQNPSAMRDPFQNLYSGRGAGPNQFSQLGGGPYRENGTPYAMKGSPYYMPWGVGVGMDTGTGSLPPWMQASTGRDSLPPWMQGFGGAPSPDLANRNPRPQRGPLMWQEAGGGGPQGMPSRQPWANVVGGLPAQQAQGGSLLGQGNLANRNPRAQPPITMQPQGMLANRNPYPLPPWMQR